MSGLRVGQVWRHRGLTEELRVDAIVGGQVTYSRGSDSWTVPALLWEEQIRLGAVELVSKAPTIPLRIRVGVTVDGQWAAISQGCRHDDAAAREVISMGVTGPIVAWHWITAEVPMPEVEQGEVAGEVER